MNGLSFLHALSDEMLVSLLNTKQVIWFSGEKYPLLFFVELYKKIERATGCSVTTLSSFDDRTVQMLEMSFLGQRLWYAFSGGDTIPAKDLLVLKNYLSKYAGPHAIFVFVPAATLPIQENHLCIELPKSITAHEYTQLYQWLYQSDKTPFFASQLSQKKSTLSLDQALSLMRYEMVLGRKNEEFWETHFLHLVRPEESLFTLSQYFFSLQTDAFFKTLSVLEKIYPPEFWIVFWLEQLWQAIIFQELATKQGVVFAKSAVSRLPFSFIQKDWKRFSSAELIQAHESLYKFDYAFKNGASDLGLSVWYMDFLSKFSR